MPHVDLGAFDRLAVDALDDAVHRGRLALLPLGALDRVVQDDVRAHLVPRRVLAVEGTQDRRLGRLARFRVVVLGTGGGGGLLRALVRHVVEQRLEPEHVGEQDELVPLLVRDVARAHQLLAPVQPLVRRQVHLARPRVQVSGSRVGRNPADGRRWRRWW